MGSSGKNADDSDRTLLDLVNRINWDYNISEKEVLGIIRNKNDESYARRCFFIKSLETFTWQELVSLWGIDECDKLYDEKTRKGLFPEKLRRIYDDIFCLLRTKTLPRAKLSPEELESLKSTVLFNRRNRFEQRVVKCNQKT